MAVDLLQILKWYTRKEVYEYEKKFEEGTIYYHYKYTDNGANYMNRVSISEIENFKVKYNI